jgi:predicted membrane protein (TIGR00267 family)
MFNFHNEPWHTPQGRLIREVVFGMNDGLISIVGFVAGANKALDDRHSLLLATLCAVFAGAISMALGAYLSSKSQVEFFKSEIEREKREIEEFPENERKEIREIYKEKGFSGEELEMVVKRITSDKRVWLDVMVKDELGLGQEQFDNPVKLAGIMGASFLAGGIVPVAPYLFLSSDKVFIFSVVFTCAALFFLGISKAKLAKRSLLIGGIEITILGGISALVGYFFGEAVKLI